MSTNSKQKKDLKLVHFFVVLLFMFGFKYLPAIGTITPYGMAILGIFIGLIYGWSVDADNLIWTSLLGLFAVGFSGGDVITSVGEGLSIGFGTQSLILIILSMFFLGMLQESGLTEFLANKILSAKFVQGHPWLLTAVIMIVPAYLSLVVHQTMLALIMFVVYSSIFKQAGYEKGDLYPAMVLMGFMLLSSLVFSLFPFVGWCLMTVGIATNAGIAINMGGWITVTTVTLLVTSVAWILVMFLVPGCKVDNLKNIDITQFQMNQDAKINKRQKAVLILLIAQVVGMVAISILSQSNVLLAKCGLYGWMALLIAVAMVVKVDGKELLDKKKAPAFFYWDLIMVLAAALVVAGQLTNEATGISPMIGIVLAPCFKLSPYMIIFIIGMATFIITNFANNLAVTITMITVTMGMATQFNFNLQLALMVITVFGVIGLLTPAGSTNGAMIYAHEYTTSKSAFTAGLLMMVLMTVIFAVVVIPLGLKLMV